MISSKYFSEDELLAAGFDETKPFDIVVLRRADAFREYLGIPCFIAIGGTNSGSHENGSQHYKGLAIDLHFGSKRPAADDILKAAINAGFMGIGIYKNKAGIYSVHLDIRSKLALWSATKGANNEWIYGAMVRL